MDSSARRDATLRRVAKGIGLTVAALLMLLATALVVARLTLTPQRLAQLVTAQLNRSLTGNFRIESIVWRLPLHLTVCKVAASPSDGSQPDLEVGEVRTTVAVWPLFTGRVRVNGLAIEHVRVRLAQPSPDAPLRLAALLTPQGPQ
ncbi:MAG: hypothetical protein EOO40_03010, partial [Deltaproteobacteria bacterium]